MKRISALLLSLLMTLSLTACGSGTEELAGAVLDAALDAVEEYESSASSAEKEVFLPEATNDEIHTSVPSDPEEIGVIGGEEFTIYLGAPEEDGYYYDLENVVLYLYCYDRLPDNFITKDEAESLGWKGGVPEYVMDGAAIGGDKFGNREGLLPKSSGRTYTECDLNTNGADERGPERLVFSNDGLYFHTEDHYKTFTEVWVENGEVVKG